MKNVNLTEEEYLRFTNSYVKDEVTKCWNWIKIKDKDGYGRIYFRKKERKAHRVSWYAFNEVVGSDFVIDHVCRNRCCVNPEHLNRTTRRENTLNGNGVGAINKRRTRCKNGHVFDKTYGKQRYCSICENEKQKRLHLKYKLSPELIGV